MKTFKVSTYGREGSLPAIIYKYVVADSFYINQGDLTFFSQGTALINNIAAFAKGQWIDVCITKEIDG